jgi:hypothetical protein
LDVIDEFDPENKEYGKNIEIGEKMSNLLQIYER